MTKKDREIVAAVLADMKTRAKTLEEYALWAGTVHQMAVALAPTNENFQRDAFVEACGY